MSAFGCVPRARVWPCARWVEPKTSPSSIAAQTPTSAASWPIATCRKPGSSPARNRSSTFSSNRRIRSISRRRSRRRSSERARLFSTFAIALSVRSGAMALEGDWERIQGGLSSEWLEARARFTIADLGQLPRAAALLGPLQPVELETGALTLRVTRLGNGPGADAMRRAMRRLDSERISGRLDLISVEDRAEVAAPASLPPPPGHLPRSWD